MTVKEQIMNGFTWFKSRLVGSIVNNCTSTSTSLPLSAAQGKSLQDQITTLNTKIENDGALARLVETTTTGWNTYTVPNLSQFKYIVFVINDGNISLFAPCIYPIYLFKQCNSTTRNAMLSEWNSVKCYAHYVSDTQISVYIGGSSRQVTAYGIK